MSEVDGPLDSRAFMDVVRARRSVRVFDPSIPIPEGVLNECLDAALLAPNSSNLQTWEFVVVRDPGTRSQLVQACMGQPAAATSRELIVCLARRDRWRKHAQLHAEALGDAPLARQNYYRKTVPLMYSVGPFGLFAPFRWVLFQLLGLRGAMVKEPIDLGDLRTWAAKSVALGCENLMLALKAHGFDSCPMEGFDRDRVKSILGLPWGADVVMVIGAGKGKP